MLLIRDLNPLPSLFEILFTDILELDNFQLLLSKHCRYLKEFDMNGVLYFGQVD